MFAEGTSDAIYKQIQAMKYWNVALTVLVK
jgi:hypothetical protein